MPRSNGGSLRHGTVLCVHTYITTAVSSCLKVLVFVVVLGVDGSFVCLFFQRGFFFFGEGDRFLNLCVSPLLCTYVIRDVNDWSMKPAVLLCCTTCMHACMSAQVVLVQTFRDPPADFGAQAVEDICRLASDAIKEAETPPARGEGSSK